MTLGSSMSEDGDTIERKLTEFITRHEAGESMNVDEFCASMGERAGELRAILEEFLGIDSALEDPHRPEETVRVSGASWADPNWGRYVSQLKSRGPAYQRYTFLGEIDRGGMGAVLRVFDNDTKRVLAMKVIKGQGVGPLRGSTPVVDSKRLGRFLEEAQVNAQLDHPGIVPVHEVGVDDDGRVYFTMKLVKGQTLRKFLDAELLEADSRRLTAAIRILHKVCEAVQYAHDKGVIHRDLKPENIMLGGYGEAYVMDWGLAGLLDRDQRNEPHDPGAAEHRVRTERVSGDSSTRGTPNLTVSDEVMGTPSYMSPEQAAARHKEVGPWSDVYSVGAILYRILSGRRPYEDPDSGNLTVVQRVRAGPPAPIIELAPRAPAELVAICDKAMARDRERRYSSMRELGDDLLAWLEGRSVLAYNASLFYLLRKWARRNRAVAILAASLVLTLPLAPAIYYAERSRAAELQRVSTERNARLERERLEALADSAAEAEKAALAKEEATRLRNADLEAELLESSRRSAFQSERDGRIAALADAWRDLDQLRMSMPSETRWDSKNYEALRQFVPRLEKRYQEMSVWRAWSTNLETRGVKDDTDREEKRLLERVIGMSEDLHYDESGISRTERLRARLQRLSPIHRESLEVARAAWNESIERVRRDPRFHDVTLEPRLGLVPIGPDPKTELEEFAHLASGVVPKLNDDGSVAENETTASIFVLLPPVRDGVEGDSSATALRKPGDSRRMPIFVMKSEMTQAQWMRIRTGKLNELAGPTVPVVEMTGREAMESLSPYGMRLPTREEFESIVPRIDSGPSPFTGLDSDPWEWCSPDSDVESDLTWIANGAEDAASRRYGPFRLTASSRRAQWIGVRCVIPWIADEADDSAFGQKSTTR